MTSLFHLCMSTQRWIRKERTWIFQWTKSSWSSVNIWIRVAIWRAVKNASLPTSRSRSAILLGAVLSSFNSLINSASTLFCIDVYQPLVGRAVSDTEMVTVAKRVGLVMTGFSLLVAPLLQFAAEGLWQVIRIFTGFYNIPMIAIVVIGLFTRQVPAVAAKVVIIFHIAAYGTFQFVLKDLVPVHFLHLYAILFVLEVAMMLAIGMRHPRQEEAAIRQTAEVDLTPWAYAQPCAVTLLSCVAALYVVFSPVGLVGDGSNLFAPVLLGLLALNMLFWFGWHRRLAAGLGVRA